MGEQQPPADVRYDRLLMIAVEPGDVVSISRNGTMIANMDVLPRPGFTDPFVQVVAAPRPPTAEPLLPADGSRRARRANTDQAAAITAQLPPAT